jgi:hypothetical protein
VSLRIEGGCHCGNIRFELDWPADQPLVGRRECGCAFCRKHGAAWTSHREAKLDVQVDDASRVSRYRFGTNTADFHVCSNCGVVPVVTCEIEDKLFGIVNVNTFEPTDGVSFTTTATDFEGEKVTDRLGRRQQNWIPSVRL